MSDVYYEPCLYVHGGTVRPAVSVLTQADMLRSAIHVGGGRFALVVVEHDIDRAAAALSSIGVDSDKGVVQMP